VAFAHSQNVVHLDIKPGNIMVGDFGQVYLMDWGIARVKGVAHESPQVPCVVGTPIYMPPEQALARDELLDERSDVFTLGGTLFEFLTLQAPFEAETINGAVILAQECKLEDPKDLVSDPRLPAELRRIALKALQSNRDDRYQSVLEFREDLLRFMRGGFEFPTVDLPKGSLIIEEGEVGEDAYVIVSGACRVFQRHGMETRELAVLGPGAVFGEMAILSAAPRAASIEATEQTHLLVINRSVIEQELDSMKPWMGALIRAFAKHALGERPRGSKNI